MNERCVRVCVYHEAKVAANGVSSNENVFVTLRMQLVHEGCLVVDLVLHIVHLITIQYPYV